MNEGLTLGGLLEDRARRFPDRPALVTSGGHASTYAQLAAQTRYLGHVLRKTHISQEHRVAVVMPNGPLMAAAFLGVGAHATCAPLNPSLRPDELEFYLTDLDARAILVPAGMDHPILATAEKMGLPSLKASVCERFGPCGFTVGDFPDTLDVDPVVEPEATALVLHTSGTTSRPKQVPLSHRNLCSSAGHIARTLQLSHDDRCLNLMPLFHIHGLVGAVMSSLWAAGSVLCSPGYDDGTFPDLIRTGAPTWYTAVPTIHQSILALARRDPSLAPSCRLRLIRSSSAALPPSVMRELEDVFGVPVLESYGMTEAAHQMASNPLPPKARKPGSVGLPAGPDMAIMDEHGQLLPAGSTGEIVIRGPNVTTGYYRNATANAEAFAHGWFRTGDLGRVDDEGYYYITGRKKEMINRGGENISPREIDEAMLEHPAVTQAIAFSVPHPTLGEDIAAAVVLAKDAQVTEAELRSFLRGRIAEFKVPSRILVVDAIPKGPTGKPQRIGLHEKLAAQLKPNFEEPAGDLEKALSHYWQDLLQLAQVGRHDNFFMCGGDSLLAASLLARLRSEMNIDLSLLELFQQPTLCEQALAIQAHRSVHDREMQKLIDELEAMSDEEARVLLEQMNPRNQPDVET